MTSNLPNEIKVEAVRDDVTYTLPRRQLGKWRWLGIFFVLFGILFLSVPGGQLAGFARQFLSGHGSFPELLFACFLIPFVIAGMAPVGIGLAIMGGHARIEWKNQALSAIEMAGPLRWRRRLSKERATITKLSVTYGATSNGQPVKSGPLADQGSLVAEFAEGRPRIVVMGYPHAWLEAIAGDLSARAGALSVTGSKPEIQVLDIRQINPDEPANVPKPPGTLVQMEESAEGITFTLPPPGVWKGSGGLMFFSIVWFSMLALFTYVSVSSSANSAALGQWKLWLFLAAFWLIGAVILTTAINLGKRRGIIRAVNGTLQVAQQNLFGTKLRKWSREEISTLYVGDSGMTVNNRPVRELQIYPVNGKKVGLFMGRNEDDLQWIAAKLRQALNVRANQP